ncbi:hypothetical protein T439DRAFT_329539 [Meredithblackwellia eburnea MCA 4105]
MSVPASNPLDTLTGQPMASQFVATAFAGPPAAGWIFHVFLFGIVANQMFAYMATPLYRNDVLITKTFLWTVIILDAATSAMNAFELFHYVTDQHRDADTLYIVLPVDAIPSITTGLVAALVQAFLARRALRLFLHHTVFKYTFLVLMGVSILVALVGAAGCGYLGIYLANGGTAENLLPFTYNAVSGAYLWICAFIDISISLALLLCLRRHIAGFNVNTDLTLRRVINLGMETAAITAGFATIGAAMAVSFPSTNIATTNVVLCFTEALGSLYVLSLLRTLSSRKSSSTSYDATTFGRTEPPRRQSPPIGIGSWMGRESRRHNVAGQVEVRREMVQVTQTDGDDVIIQVDGSDMSDGESKGPTRPLSAYESGLKGTLQRPEAAMWA